jgi:hypothetical protein
LSVNKNEVEGSGEGKCKETTDTRGMAEERQNLNVDLNQEGLMYMADCQDKIQRSIILITMEQ